WEESWSTINGTCYHSVAPTPFATIEEALAELTRMHPNTHVDTLCDRSEINAATRIALDGGIFEADNA
ncbi:MAG: hypothetical protein KGL39_04075, partial [Patescibacteria group bacterium]|nr:hypothetical protein [Patescibacteria group bacterium]